VYETAAPKKVPILTLCRLVILKKTKGGCGP